MNFTLPILSFLGVINALILYWQYNRYLKTGKKMYCLMGEDCAKVVGSKYGTHLGFKNEMIGIGYYLLVTSYWVALQKFDLPEIVNSPILILSVVSILFSIYLIYIQAYVVKTFCSWCLIAIGINLLIFYAIVNLIIPV